MENAINKVVSFLKRLFLRVRLFLRIHVEFGKLDESKDDQRKEEL